ncbi:MAG: transcription-repair coupling factor [Chloroflexota bacterium]
MNSANEGLLNLEGWDEAATDTPNATKFTKPVENLESYPDLGSLTFVNASLAEGFTLIRREDNHVVLNLLSDAEIFGWNRPAPRRWKAPSAVAPETHFADIKAGDYVVHLEYGIGLFKGLVSRTIGGMDREYLLLEYANGDVLYVPAHHADRLGKWIGSDDRPPAITRLGGKTWTTMKAKAQRAADELAGDLLELYASRETVPGHAFAEDTEWQAELEASFPYQETEDQLRVIAEVKADMERPLPMDRLICGDVGYGKTEVALRAAFKAVMDNKQVAILVPTTVLAQQHYNTFTERLKPFPAEIEMLSRFRTPTQQQRIVKDLRNGRVDIIIGTHRLLSDDISFKDLGLVIIDEEQRFGVAHKEKLKQWRTEVDVLTMTATPIPRTLHMSLTGVRDISIIDTAPTDRLPVQTYVGAADESRLKRAIMREIDRGGQIFMVHNRVQTIDIIAAQVQKLVPEAILAIGHGQMSERQLERIMNSFSDGKIDILLSTTIIESGLDIPNANTIIIDRAEMFGLAQMYQLKGRVGRGTRRAYAYFFHSAWRTLNADAQLRLETIAENTDLGAGYTIAMRDMEIRGVGDLLGGQQSGHISAVGFDLYTRLLKNAVKQQKAAKKGETVSSEFPDPTTIDVPLAAYLPTDYIPDPGLRLRLYRRMALLDTLDETEEMAEELADRFGPIPDPVHNLLYQLRVKSLAQKSGVISVTVEAGQIKIRLADMELFDRHLLQAYLGPQVRVSKKALWMARDLSTHEWQVALVQVLERLEELDRRTVRAENDE